jgi:Flp pilus assembly protein TadG
LNLSCWSLVLLIPSISYLRRTLCRRRSVRGQALVELAIVLPLLLAIAGITVDFARVYQASIALHGATRNAAEYVASFCPDNDKLKQDCLPSAVDVARSIICLETQDMAGYAGSGTSCTSPSVTILHLAVDASAPGATAAHPIGSATVESTLEFRMLFNYPLLTRDGAWTITATESFSVVQGY